MSTYCFPVLIFLFLLVLEFICLAREFTYCHFRNVIRLALSDVIFFFLQVVVFVVLELTLVLWCLSVATVRRRIYSLKTCCNVHFSDKIFNRNSSGHLTQTCPALAIKTATILKLVSRENRTNEKLLGES